MTTTVTPFLWFDDAAEEAAELYVATLPDSRILDVSRYGEGGPMPAGRAMVVVFEVAGLRVQALNGGPGHTLTPAFSLAVTVDTQAEVDRIWAALTEGGSEGRCGWLVDRYGVSWQVVPAELPSLLGDPDPGRASRAMTAMLGMSRLDVAALRAAADAG